MSRVITISQQVWEAIAERGRFGETEDDVLRRVFKLPSPEQGAAHAATDSATRNKARAQPRRSFATDRMTSYISGNELRVSFASGPSNSWKLPPRDDKNAIRAVRDTATAFAEAHQATLGQVNAVKKTLTDAGYYVLK